MFKNTIFKSRFIALIIINLKELLTYKFNRIRYIANVTMVYKCAAINCRSGYRGEKHDQKVTFHSFPLEDKHLLQTWLKQLARKD